MVHIEKANFVTDRPKGWTVCNAEATILYIQITRPDFKCNANL